MDIVRGCLIDLLRGGEDWVLLAREIVSDRVIGDDGSGEAWMRRDVVSVVE